MELSIDETERESLIKYLWWKQQQELEESNFYLAIRHLFRNGRYSNDHAMGQPQPIVFDQSLTPSPERNIVEAISIKF